MLFFIFITKNMKEEHGFLITYGSLRPLRALRGDFSYVVSCGCGREKSAFFYYPFALENSGEGVFFWVYLSV
jgi:hypothetical protein